MTYPAAARLFYVCLLVWFFGGFAALNSLGLFNYFGLIIGVIWIAGYWLSEVVLICPVCGQRVGKSKSGYYAPWVGPKCRYCEADLSQHRVSLHRQK